VSEELKEALDRMRTYVRDNLFDGDTSPVGAAIEHAAEIMAASLAAIDLEWDRR
jgi:hypothetical protein